MHPADPETVTGRPAPMPAIVEAGLMTTGCEAFCGSSATMPMKTFSPVAAS